uniref:Uncharacterized protein n=1 Tax=Glossina morsitans morsitans TaxID=37546 RepID=A0A1B0FRD0_GLOMM
MNAVYRINKDKNILPDTQLVGDIKYAPRDACRKSLTTVFSSSNLPKSALWSILFDSVLQQQQCKHLIMIMNCQSEL